MDICPTKILKKKTKNIIFSKSLYSKSNSGVIIRDASDHLPCLSVLKDVKTGTCKKVTITKRDMKGCYVASLKAALSNLDWETELAALDINEKFNKFYEILLTLLDTHFPIKTKKVSSKQRLKEPWITKGLLNCIQRKKQYYKEFLKDRSDQIETKYKNYQNKLQRLLRYAKCDCYINQCITLKSNTKKLWLTINAVTKKITDKSCVIEAIKIDNLEYSDSSTITNAFGRYFSQVGSDFANKIKRSNKPIKSYLKNINWHERSVFLIPCTQEEILRLINKLPNKISHGYDGVSNVLLKELKDYLVLPLIDIFNESLQSGIFPDSMKHAEITPFYKKGAKNLTTNYWPISLLITVSKLLEKVMYSRIYDFLNESRIYTSQYGFRKFHSCENAITELVSNIIKGWESKKNTLAIFLDLSKAFDTLQHSVLFNKLECYGIRGVALDWFKSYLLNHTLSVKCKIKSSGTQEKSHKYIVDYGTPQGSCLGPLLFLIFNNDLHKVLENC